MSVFVQDVIDVLTTPSLELKNSVDGLISGSIASRVAGIATAFLATQEVIETAKKMGLNLIVSHEGIFYSHNDSQDRLLEDSVFSQKQDLIEKGGVAIYRYHDYIHRFIPDGITAGLLIKLGWREYEVENKQFASILEIPEITVWKVLELIKEKLNLSFVRYLADPGMKCRRVGVLVGYRGSGKSVIPLFEESKLDLVIYGEGPEWETPEYVRDAVHQGYKKALIVLGHAESETPGMESLTRWLQGKIPEVPVHFIRNNSLFQIY